MHGDCAGVPDLQLYASDSRPADAVIWRLTLAAALFAAAVVGAFAVHGPGPVSTAGAAANDRVAQVREVLDKKLPGVCGVGAKAVPIRVVEDLSEPVRDPVTWGISARPLAGKAIWYDEDGDGRPPFRDCLVLLRRQAWSTVDLCTVLAHEFLHLWGLKHRANPKSVMYRDAPLQPWGPCTKRFKRMPDRH